MTSNVPRELYSAPWLEKKFKEVLKNEVGNDDMVMMSSIRDFLLNAKGDDNDKNVMAVKTKPNTNPYIGLFKQLILHTFPRYEENKRYNILYCGASNDRITWKRLSTFYKMVEYTETLNKDVHPDYDMGFRIHNLTYDTEYSKVSYDAVVEHDDGKTSTTNVTVRFVPTKPVIARGLVADIICTDMSEHDAMNNEYFTEILIPLMQMDHAKWIHFVHVGSDQLYNTMHMVYCDKPDANMNGNEWAEDYRKQSLEKDYFWRNDKFDSVLKRVEV